MTTFVLATFWTSIIAIAFAAVSLILIGVVLLQKNRGSGLSGAFGGVGGHSAFGTKTGDVLTWFTVGVTGVFLLLAVLGNYAYDMSGPAKPAPTIVPAGTEPPPPPTNAEKPEAPINTAPTQVPLQPTPVPPPGSGSTGASPAGTGGATPAGSTPQVNTPAAPNPPTESGAPKSPN